MVIKDILPGLRTEYVTPHVCARCMEHIADDWEYCPYCGEPTGLFGDAKGQSHARKDSGENREERDGKGKVSD